MHEITEITLADYPSVRALWEATEGICLDETDSPEELARFLDRNPGCSFVACVNGNIVGVVLSGYDLRRGFLYHLAVQREYRLRGIARDLVNRCLSRLRQEGVKKCHLFVAEGNDPARSFWSHLGWQERHDILPMSIRLS
jgi:N-acetylglutamate synthase